MDERQYLIEAIRARESGDEEAERKALTSAIRARSTSPAPSTTVKDGQSDGGVIDTVLGAGKDAFDTLGRVGMKIGTGEVIPKYEDTASLGKTFFDALGRIGMKIGTGEIIPRAEDTGKGIQNFPSDFMNQAAGTLEAVANPIDTITGLGSLFTDKAKHGQLEDMLVDTVDLRKRVRDNPAGLLLDALPAGKMAGAASGKLAKALDASQVLPNVASGAKKAYKGIVGRALGTGGKRTNVIEEVNKLAKDPATLREFDAVRKGEVRLSDVAKDVTEGAQAIKEQATIGFADEVAKLPDAPIPYDNLKNNALSTIQSYNVNVRPNKIKRVGDGKAKRWEMDNSGIELDFDTGVGGRRFASANPADRKMIERVANELEKNLSDNIVSVHDTRMNIASLLDDVDFLNATVGQKVVTQIVKEFDDVLTQAYPQYSQLLEDYATKVSSANAIRREFNISGDANIGDDALMRNIQKTFMDTPSGSDRMTLIREMEDASNKKILPKMAAFATEDPYGSGVLSRILQTGALGGAVAGGFAGSLPATAMLALPVLGATSPKLNASLARTAGRASSKVAPVANRLPNVGARDILSTLGMLQEKQNRDR